MQKDYLYYLNLFIQNVQLAELTDYTSKNSVRVRNQAVDQYRKAAYTISREFPEKTRDFAKLLEHDDPNIRICCAVCLVELMQTDSMTRKRAIQLIKTEIHNGNATPVVGWEIWLKRHDKDGLQIE